MCSLLKEIKLHLLDIILKSVGSSVGLMPPSHTSLSWPQLRFPPLIGTVCSLQVDKSTDTQSFKPVSQSNTKARGSGTPRDGYRGQSFHSLAKAHREPVTPDVYLGIWHAVGNKSEKKGMRSSVEADILMEQGHIPRGANIWLLRVNMLGKREAKKGELGSRDVAVRVADLIQKVTC